MIEPMDKPSQYCFPRDVQPLLEAAVVHGRSVSGDGKLAGYIPELLKADVGAVGISVAMLDGSRPVSCDYSPRMRLHFCRLLGK
jgi:glutaminase